MTPPLDPSLRRRRRPPHNTIVAYLALFVALGGTSAYAANTIGSADVINESLLSEDIKDTTIKRADIASNAISSDRVDVDTLTSDDLATGSVKGDEIADGAVKGVDIGTNSIGPVHLSTGAVGYSDLQPGVVDSSKIANGSVTESDVAAEVLGKAYGVWKDSEITVDNTGPVPDNGPAWTTVLTLNVPAGKYLAFGKASLRQTNVAGADPECRLVAGADFDESTTGIEGSQNGENQQYGNVSMTVLHSFASNGQIIMRCRDNPGMHMKVSWRKIHALRVGSYTNVQG